jgi:hypothetical protein
MIVFMRTRLRRQLDQRGGARPGEALRQGLLLPLLPPLPRLLLRPPRLDLPPAHP